MISASQAVTQPLLVLNGSPQNHVHVWSAVLGGAVQKRSLRPAPAGVLVFLLFCCSHPGSFLVAGKVKRYVETPRLNFSWALGCPGENPGPTPATIDLTCCSHINLELCHLS